jgi:AcrR family transcriptional regulator
MIAGSATMVGRRERKKRATRLALKAAALELAAERGFAHVTVEDIADAADVSVRTFFNYFASKEAALVGEDAELVEALKDDLVALPASLSPLAAVRTVLLARLQAIADDLDRSGEDHEVWLRRMEVVRAQPEVRAAYLKHLSVLEQALTDGVLARLGGGESRRPYASLLAACALAVMRVAGTCHSGAGGTTRLIALAEQGFDSLAGGLAPPPPRTGGKHAKTNPESRR